MKPEPDRPAPADGLFRRLPAELSDALDGYPVAALLALSAIAGAGGARSKPVAQVVIDRWITILSHDIDGIAIDNPDALVRIRGRLVRTREALRTVRDLACADEAVPA